MMMSWSIPYFPMIYGRTWDCQDSHIELPAGMTLRSLTGGHPKYAQKVFPGCGKNPIVQLVHLSLEVNVYCERDADTNAPSVQNSLTAFWLKPLAAIGKKRVLIAAWDWLGRSTVRRS